MNNIIIYISIFLISQKLIIVIIIKYNNYLESLVTSKYSNNFNFFKSIIINPANTNLISRVNIISTYLERCVF